MSLTADEKKQVRLSPPTAFTVVPLKAELSPHDSGLMPAAMSVFWPPPPDSSERESPGSRRVSRRALAASPQDRGRLPTMVGPPDDAGLPDDVR